MPSNKKESLWLFPLAGPKSSELHIWLDTNKKLPTLVIFRNCWRWSIEHNFVDDWTRIWIFSLKFSIKAKDNLATAKIRSAENIRPKYLFRKFEISADWYACISKTRSSFLDIFCTSTTVSMVSQRFGRLVPERYQLYASGSAGFNFSILPITRIKSRFLPPSWIPDQFSFPSEVPKFGNLLYILPDIIVLAPFSRAACRFTEGAVNLFLSYLPSELLISWSWRLRGRQFDSASIIDEKRSKYLPVKTCS